MKPILILTLFFIASSAHWAKAADDPQPNAQPSSDQKIQLIGKITRSAQGVYLINTSNDVYYVPKNLPDLFKQENLWVKAEGQLLEEKSPIGKPIQLQKITSEPCLADEEE